MTQLTDKQLLVIAPRVPSANLWSVALNQAMGQFLILTLPRISMFLAQLCEESSEFTRLEENLRYSAEGLVRTWRSKFPTVEFAKAYAYQPSKIANYVYANRYGNGSEVSGDGWKYRGRGPIQITFQANYENAGLDLQLPLVGQPELLLTPLAGSLAAAHYWQTHGCNELADGSSDKAFEAVTYKINAAGLGMENRKMYWKRAYHALRNLT